MLTPRESCAWWADRGPDVIDLSLLPLGCSAVVDPDTEVMSATLTGSRAADGRRRRRLAVAGDGSDTDTAENEAARTTAGLRSRLAELPSASPWLPRAPWKCISIVVGFWLILLTLGGALFRASELPSPLAKLLVPLTTGPQPKLLVYGETVLWLLAAELAGLVGWYRSHSQLDFRGRYRLWGAVVVVLALASAMAGTGLHGLIAEQLAPMVPQLRYKPAILLWWGPALLVGVIAAGLVDRDIRRCRSALWLFRLAVTVHLAVAAGVLMDSELSCEAWYVPAMVAGRWLACGLLVTALWRQGLYVAYVCADPPERTVRAASTGFGLWAWLARRWWKRAEPVEEPAPRRRRKKADAAEESEEGTTRRRRKTTGTRTRKTTRTRPRKTSVVEEDATDEVTDDEEASSDSSWEEAVVDTETSAVEQQSEEEGWDDELARLEALTRPDPAPAPTSRNDNKRPQRRPDPEPEAEAEQDDDSGEDDARYRVDAGHSDGDMYKGLSKRQRREMKKQQRDQERQRSGARD